MGNKLPPFLKWPGGKRWLINKYSTLFPTKFDRYFEPFLGGGAIFFALCPQKAILSDINVELINLYKVMRDKYADLIAEMKKHQEKHSKEYYYQIRNEKYHNDVQAAGRFLYLNRTCYNGLYRVNKAGKFNVPIGSKNNCIYDTERYYLYSALLKNTELEISDFDKIISYAGTGDLIFADPPYTISGNQNSFIKYNEHLFSWDDQVRLHTALSDAKARGVTILATNSGVDQLKCLYKQSGFYVKTLERHSLISGNPKKRRKQEEMLISSNPFNE